MADDFTNNSQNNSTQGDNFESFCNLISAATDAESAGNADVAISLYIAAYQVGKNCDAKSVENSVAGLQNAWRLALSIKNRPLCEQIFALLENHMTDEQMDKMGKELNNLMLDKLSGLGLSLGEIADNMDIEQVMNRIKSAVEKTGDGTIDVQFKNNPGYKNPKFSGNSIAERIEAAKQASAGTSKKVDESSKNNAKSSEDENTVRRHIIKYKDIVGYESAINTMRERGYGIGADSTYSQLVEKLNREHGLNRVAFTKPLVFRSNSRYDAKMFMEATVGEIGLPCMRMRVDENIHGANVLCVLMPNEGDFKLNPGRTGFFGRGIIVLEDFDLWELPEVGDIPPLPEDEEGLGKMLAAHAKNSQLQEVYNLIDVALSDPDVMLVANITNENASEMEIGRFFDDYDIVDVDLPSERERAAIWTTLANDHPSLRAFSTQKLVRYSDNMSRYEIEVAVHDALEEAYKEGIAQRQYVPLSISNLIEKLAEHQDPDSVQYRQLEDAAAADFARGLDNIDDILK